MPPTWMLRRETGRAPRWNSRVWAATCQRLTAHQSGESPLQYALTKVAGLIAPAGPSMTVEEPSECPVNEHSFKDYVLAALGMPHNANRITPELAPYLDELSRNASTWLAQPVTRSSFSLLCVLYATWHVPGTDAYHKITRASFMGWLNRQLAPATIRDDCIPEDFFHTVQVRAALDRCTVRCGQDGAPSVEVRAMQRQDFRGEDLRGAHLTATAPDLTSVDLTCSRVAYANLSDTNISVS
ncbi:hypothetical protein, partial [Paraburkholderia sediminicola]|uniref:hypothetical protein n=1 Tax=Paraburkholderia sediminicola TaxID=458836 RepID=UPI0038BA471C